MMNPDLLHKSQEEAIRQEQSRKTNVPKEKVRRVCPYDGHELPCQHKPQYAFRHPSPAGKLAGCKC